MAIYKRWDFDSLSYTHPTGTEAGQGFLKVTTDGQVIIQITFPGPKSLVVGYVDVTGTSVSGRKMTARGRMTNVTFGVNPFVQIRPIDVMVYEPGANQSSQFDEMVWHLKNAKVLLCPHVEVINNYIVTLESIQGPNNKQFEGEITTLLRSKRTNISSGDLGEFHDDLSRLLSLAQRCPTPPVVKEFFQSGNLVYTAINEQSWDYITLRPLIEWYAKDTLEFIKATYLTFVQQKDRYGLITLIDYYWRSHVENTIEIKFLYASIFMEALKFNWAANVSTNLDKDLKVNGLVRGFRPRGASARTKNLDFESLLIQTAQFLGYPCTQGTFTFIDDRNCIFHSGLSSAPQHGHVSSWPVIKPELEKLYLQIDDLLLRILGFSGTIFEVDLTSGIRKVSFPSRQRIP